MRLRRDGFDWYDRHTVAAGDTPEWDAHAVVEGPEETITTRVALGQWREAVDRAIANGTITAALRDVLYEHRLRPALMDQPYSAGPGGGGRGQAWRATRTLADLSRAQLVAS
jgi:hypothetical protein